MAIDEPLMSEFGRLPDHPAIRPDCILCCRGNSSTHVWLEQVGISRSIPFRILEYSTDAHGKWSAGPPGQGIARSSIQGCRTGPRSSRPIRTSSHQPLHRHSGALASNPGHHRSFGNQGVKPGGRPWGDATLGFYPWYHSPLARQKAPSDLIAVSDRVRNSIPPSMGHHPAWLEFSCLQRNTAIPTRHPASHL